ncbi:PAS domain-containing protein [Burkholderia sp. 8Y]|uniref:PAS domain-containing protein n=1 Tax=Burkholderia sp. 8Y TaxID=2653133 RepID=UPI00135B41AA|nr:PAS domain-containing protein [Burkholderia sp. 8Y]
MLILFPGLDFVISAASDAYIREAGTPRQEIVGSPLLDAFERRFAQRSPDNVEKVRSSLATVVETKSSHQILLDCSDRTSQAGSGRYWRIENTPVLSSSGELLCIVHFMEDFTRCVRCQEDTETLSSHARTLEAELQVSTAAAAHHLAERQQATLSIQKLIEDSEVWRLGEQQFRVITDSLPQPVWTARSDGYVDYLNRRFFDFAGVPAEFAVGERFCGDSLTRSESTK